MSASQRTKGAVGEREWCHVLKKRGIEAKRDVSQTQDGGGDVPAPPFLFEVKRRKGIASVRFLEQAEAALAKYDGCTVPAVAMREDGDTNWVVMLRGKDFLDLVAATRHAGWNMPKANVIDLRDLL